MNIKTLSILSYLSLQSSVNYIRISNYIGVSKIRLLSVRKRVKYCNSLKLKASRYGSIVLDLDTELHYKGLNVFNTVITDLLGLGNIIVLVHTEDMYRRLLLYSELHSIKLKVFLVNKNIVAKDKVNNDGISLLNNIIILDLKDRVTMVTSERTVLSIIKDLIIYQDGIQDIKEVIINIDGVKILDLYRFYKVLRDTFKDKLVIVSSDSTIQAELKLVYAYYRTTTSTKKDLLREILMSIELDTVVLFYTYSLGRKDMYSRRGLGEIESVKVGIFRGINKYGNLLIETYTTGSLESGIKNRVLESLSISSVGFLDTFLGTKHHIELPILKDAMDVGSFEIDNKQVLCGEYIGYLLDKNNIKYNKLALNSCIDISYSNLQKLYNGNIE